MPRMDSMLMLGGARGTGDFVSSSSQDHRQLTASALLKSFWIIWWRFIDAPAPPKEHDSDLDVEHILDWPDDRFGMAVKICS